jgi:ATP-binding cassette subfamily F protein uup
VPAKPARVKLTFNERRELDALPGELEALEREQHALTAAMCAPDYHRQGGERIRGDRARAEEIERLLAEKFERWDLLDRKAQAAGGQGPST